MSLDLVHDTQETYRILLDCMAHPGRIGSLARIQDHIPMNFPLNKGLLLLALTLLDGESSFSVPREDDSANASTDVLTLMESHLASTCCCPITRPEQAAFLFLPHLDESSFADGLMLFKQRTRWAIQIACRGTFYAPQLGATIILEIEQIVDSSATITNWILEGPGIDGTSRFACGPRGSEVFKTIVEARNSACSEFPLGVDLVIIDREFHLVCIPRTSSLREA